MPAQVMEFYSQQARSNNYAYREAVCACLAELAERLDHPVVQPHVPAMLRLLLSLLRDDSWPVCPRLPCVEGFGQSWACMSRVCAVQRCLAPSDAALQATASGRLSLSCSRLGS